MSTFRQYGGINYAATNNIVRNNISNSDNLGVSNIMGLPNTTITCLSNFIVSQESNFDVTGNAVIDGTLSVAGATTLSDTLDVAGATTLSDLEVVGTTIFDGPVIVNYNNTNQVLGYGASTTLGTNNTGFGYNVLKSANSSSNDNVAFGSNALFLDYGSSNVALGSSAGSANLTGNNNTFIGTNTNLNNNGLSNSTALGNGTLITASNQIVLGNSSVTSVTTTASVTASSFNSSSDYRIKENVLPLDETFTIDNLRPVTYFNSSINKQDIGFIAHEVQEFFPYLVNGEKDGETNQSLNYNGLIGLLVKEIQDLKQQVNNLKTENQNFKHVISEILPRIK